MHVCKVGRSPLLGVALSTLPYMNHPRLEHNSGLLGTVISLLPAGLAKECEIYFRSLCPHTWNLGVVGSGVIRGRWA